jgi:Gpi18-like mannosyltransferase
LSAVAGSGRVSSTWRTLAAYGLSRIYVFAIAIGVAIASSYSLPEILSRWDGGWYLSIVRSGYPTVVPTRAGDPSSLAFFPGYPLLVRALSRPVGLSPVLIGVIVATAAGAGAAIALHRLASDLIGDPTADRTVILFSFFPTAFVLSMVYADALFLLFAAVCLVALIERRWLLAGVATAAASSVRPTALVLVACCVWAAAEAIYRRREWFALVAPALAPIGALAYFAYLRVHTGDALAFVKAEDRGWNRRFDFGVWNVRSVVGYLGDRRTTFLILVFAILLLGAAVAFWLMLRWRPPAVIVVYVVGIVALTVLASHPVSLPRYLLSAFPLLIPVADRVSGRRFTVLVVVSAVLLGVLFSVTSVSSHLPP